MSEYNNNLSDKEFLETSMLRLLQLRKRVIGNLYKTSRTNASSLQDTHRMKYCMQQTETDFSYPNSVQMKLLIY